MQFTNKRFKKDKKNSRNLFQALEFAADPTLTDTLGRLWVAVRELGEETIKWVGDEKSLTRVMDNYRRLMPEIKRSIVTEQKMMEKLNEVLKATFIVLLLHYFVLIRRK